jgi:hypothetical protein
MGLIPKRLRQCTLGVGLFFFLPGVVFAEPYGFPDGVTKTSGTATGYRVLDVASEQAAFLELINGYRAQNGLAVLGLDSNLQAAALWLSQDMGSKKYFSHTDSLGRSASQRMTDFGYTASTRGENIAAGYATAAAVMQGWKNSPGHNANMLNAAYRAIGIGLAYAPDSPYGWYWTTDFGSVVQNAPAPTPTQLPAALAAKTACVYPNPAQNEATFFWQPPSSGFAKISLFNMAGQKVAEIESQTAGQTALAWDTRTVAPGVYLGRLEVNTTGAVRRETLKIAIEK